MRRHALTFLLILIGSSLFAQTLKKADKDFELGNLQSALSDYQKLSLKDPSNGVISSRIGDVFRLLNQITEAENWYDKAVNQTGADPKTLLHLGNVQKMLGKYEEAKSSYDRYAFSDPAIGKHFAKSCDFALEMINSPSPYVVKSEYINNENDDFGPAEYGEHLAFSTTRGNTADNDFSKLVLSNTDQNNFLKEPVDIRPQFDRLFGEGPMSFSSEAGLVFFTKNNFKKGVRQIPAPGIKISLFFAYVEDNGSWTEAQPFPYNGSGYSSGYPSLSRDGKTLFFASDRPDGFGGWDIYISRKIGDTWTRPENLGPIVNTEGNENSPFFDGVDIYFSSDWHHGLGGFDIFKATRMDGDWNGIFHLGAQVNSSGDDLGFIFHPAMHTAYFASNRAEGKGGMDLFKADRQTDEIIIIVVDAQGSPIANANIDLTECNEGNYQTSTDGIYKFQALGGFYCQASVSQKGFVAKQLILESQGKQMRKEFNVVLSKDFDQVGGIVLNGQSKKPEAGVLVRATNQGTGEFSESYSDAKGFYSLGLAPNAVYVIRYSKVGFTDTHDRVKTPNSIPKDFLDKIYFDPVYAVIAENEKDSGKELSQTSSDSKYSIQIAATANGSNIDLESYNKLAGIGNVFVVEENGMSKVRVGNFKSRASADVAQKNIRAQGFPEAFVVQQLIKPELVESKTEPTKKPIPKPKTTVVSNPIETKAVTIKSNADRINAKYKIRLATYRNTSYFKPGKVLEWGKIEKVKQGGLTIMLLSSFDTLDEAKKVMARVRENGFKTAHVVYDIDRELKRQY